VREKEKGTSASSPGTKLRIIPTWKKAGKMRKQKQKNSVRRQRKKRKERENGLLVINFYFLSLRKNYEGGNHAKEETREKGKGELLFGGSPSSNPFLNLPVPSNMGGRTIIPRRR